jgi:hypothetical protein
MMKQLNWTGLYNESWQGEIVPEAFAHPAKFSRALIRRIYQYLLDEGLIKPGDSIVDPFGGVGLGGRDAADIGLTFWGNELELRFVILALRNIVCWAERDWCTCGKESQDYLSELREIIRERGGRSEQGAGGEVRPVLQPGLFQQFSLQGQKAVRGKPPIADGADTLEQGQSAQRGNKGENIEKGKEKNGGIKPELEGRNLSEAGWLSSNSSERPLQDGTHSHYGTASWAENDAGGSCSPHQRQQNRQQAGKFEGDDGIGTHETSQRQRGDFSAKEKDLCDLRENIPRQTQPDFMQRALQARKAANILAKERRAAEGKYCKKCFKLIVQFPIVTQGDSRELARVIGGAAGCVSSPPYIDAVKTGEGPGAAGNEPQRARQAMGAAGENAWRNEGKYGRTPGQLGAMPPGDFDAAVSSPPYADSVNQKGNGIDVDKMKNEHDRRPRNDNSNLGNDMFYGRTAGQLGSMKEGDFTAAVTSPPYADTVDGGDGPGARFDPAGHTGNPDKVSSAASYGRSPGQLGSMDAAVTSPPFEASLGTTDKEFAARAKDDYEEKRSGRRYSDAHLERTKELCTDYVSTPGNVGNDTGASFWQAARAIVEQVYAVLKPGGAAAFVTGDFVRRGERVEFGRQWLELCEAVGFEPYAWAVAWKTEYKGTQLDIFGGEVERRVDRVSFFRRLANERNPEAAVLNEDVIIVRKPI